MLPASREECYGYDPRRRPWFVAASSGPKDLVLVLDTSGSMNDYGRLDLLKEAAITGELKNLIQTLLNLKKKYSTNYSLFSQFSHPNFFTST